MKMKPPVKLLRTTASNPLVEIAFSGERNWPPALLTRPSMRPYLASTASMAPTTMVSSRMSQARLMACPPSSSISRCTSVSFSTVLPTIATLAPSAASSWALHRREVDRVARLRYDKGAAAFAQAGVGITDNRDRGDGRMLVEKIFDLHYRNVLAAPDQNVLHPTRDANVAFVIHAGEIARVEPALRIERFQLWLLVITCEHLTAAHQ